MSTSGLALFARSMLRGSGWGCVLNLEAHFDESGTDAQELTVAGYLFESERIDAFCNKWERILLEYNVPYFHMIECANGSYSFKHLDKNRRISLQMRLMRLISGYSINGFVCNISNVPSNSGSSYGRAVEMVVGSLMDWADTTAFQGKIAYFLEAGASGQGLADANFRLLAQDPVRKGAQRYAGHAFVPKQGNPGVQAADLLAWQYHNFTKRRAKASVSRLDLRALFRHPHMVVDQCGEPPRKSNCQSVEQSRNRIQSVHYLPRVTEEEAHSGALFAPSLDAPPFIQEYAYDISSVFACPDCLRALCELHESNTVANLYFKCWCGTFCATPDRSSPFMPRR